jgi:uncharacterized coiled-coil protein SlyX
MTELNRIQELENQVAFLEHELEELNKVLTDMNLEHMLILKKLESLNSRVEELTETSLSQGGHAPHTGANR